MTEHSKSFFGTVLGCITAVAGLITAVGGLIAILYQIDVIGPRRGDPAPLANGGQAGGSHAAASLVGGAPANTVDEQLQRKQARLELLLQQAERNLGSGDAEEETMDARYANVPAQLANVAGPWRAVSGLTYTIYQQGGSLVLQETNPLTGAITAVGSGTIDGPNLTFGVTTAAWTTGTAYLRLSNDGRQLAGQYQDATTGMVVALQLFR